MRATLDTILALQLFSHVRCIFVVVQVLELHSSDDQTDFCSNLMRRAFGIQEQVRTPFHFAYALLA